MSCEDTKGKEFAKLFGSMSVREAIEKLGINSQGKDKGKRVSSAMDIETATKEINQKPTIN